MFGTNEIVGAKFFKDAPKDSLFVTSMFFTIQGEGPFSGMPALFIRLAKCNLACKFCFPSHYPINVKGKGTMRLDEVQVGDEVLTLDDKLAPTYTKIKATNSRWVDKDDMVTVTYKEPGKAKPKYVVVTKDHPFNVKGKGFVEAGKLKPNQVIHHLPGDDRTSFRMADNNPMFNPEVAKAAGKQRSEDYLTGRITAYIRTQEWRDNQSRRMSVKNPMHDNDVVKKVTESKVYEKSKLEKLVHKVLKTSGFDVVYTGNRKGWMIGDKESGYMRPDFYFKGTKKLLEVYDKSYPFYTDDRTSSKGEAAYKKKRKEHYAKFGFDVGFLTAQNLGLKRFYEAMTVPTQVVQAKVNKFLTNGVKVLSVEPVKMRSINAPFSKAGTYKDGKVKVTNFTCDGNNTFCMKGLHTHNCDTFFDDGDWMTFKQIEAKAYSTICDYWNTRGLKVPLWAVAPDRPEFVAKSSKLGPYPGVVLVVTGGEPLLQPNLYEFLDRQRWTYKTVQIESNGTFNAKIPPYVKLVCSPKCYEKEGKPQSYLKPTDLILQRADYLKFVVSADETSPYHTVPDWVETWETQHLSKGDLVYISPMNVYNEVPQQSKILRLTKRGDKITMDKRSTVDEVISFWTPGLLNLEQNQKNHEYAARYCMDNGYKLNLQTHLYAGLA